MSVKKWQNDNIQKYTNNVDPLQPICTEELPVNNECIVLLTGSAMVLLVQRGT